MPPSSFPNKTSLLDSFNTFSRSLRLCWFFGPNNNLVTPLRFSNPTWNPSQVYPPLENLIKLGQSIFLQSISCSNIKQNQLPSHLHIALKTLWRNRNIVILPIDKKMGVCMLDCKWYVNEAYRQLGETSVYKMVLEVPFEAIYYRLQSLLNIFSDVISLDETRYILQ